MEPFDATLRFLARVRNELAAVARGETVFAIVLVLVLTAALGLSLAAALGAGPGRWGWLVVAAGLGAVGYIVWRFWLRPRRLRAANDTLALWVEERVPVLGSGLVTAVEAGQLMRQKPAEALGFSPRLATEAAVRAAAVLERVEPARLPDRHRLVRLRWGFIGALAAGTGLAFLAPDLWARGATNLVAPAPDDGDDGVRYVDVAVSQLELEVRPPAYTGLERRKLPKSSGDVEALVGSEVRFTTTALFPVTAAALILQSDPESRWLLELETDGTIRGSFQVGADDWYQLVVTDAQGQTVRERVWRRVTATEDRAPEVTLLLPEQDLEVKPTDTIDFFYESSDDIGIGKVELVVVGENGDVASRKLVAEPRGNRIDKGSTVVEVAGLGLEPGQYADIHFEVSDQKQPGQPGIGKSQARRIQIYSPADEHDKLLGRLRALIEQMLDVLAERLESPIDAKNPYRLADVVPLHQSIAAATEAIMKEFDAILQGLSTDTLVKDEMRVAARKVLDAIRDVHDQEQAQLKRWVLDPDSADPKVIASLLDQTNDEAIDVFEQGILELKRLLDGALKDAILEAGRDLLETQNEIMELMKKLKAENDPAVREALMKKLHQLQEKLKKLQAQMARAQERAPYENQNATQRPNENEQSAEDMADKMDQIQKLLEEGKIDEAMKLMEEMARDTQELMAALENDLEGGGGPQLSQETRKKLREAQQEAEETADGQRGLQRETEALEKQIAERQEQMLKERAEKARAELQQKAKELREALEQAPKGAMPSADQRAMQGLEQAAQELEKALEERQIGQAGSKARSLSEDAQALGEEVGESSAREMNRGKAAELDKAGDQLGKAAGLAKEIAEMIEGMQPGPGEGMTPGESQKIGELGKRQRQLQQKLEGLKQKLGELEGEMPGIQGELGPPLDEAGKKMGEAGEKLDGNQPGPATGDQQEAVENLEKFKQGMRERMKRSQRPGGQDDESTGINDPEAEVPIPKEDPYARPRKLREEILKMMDEQAPERYRDAIKKFYEDLTK